MYEDLDVPQSTD
jgi:hypothetical protein